MTARVDMLNIPRRVRDCALTAEAEFDGTIVEVTRCRDNFYFIVVQREADYGYWEGEYWMPEPWIEFNVLIVKYVGRRQPVDVYLEIVE